MLKDVLTAKPVLSSTPLTVFINMTVHEKLHNILSMIFCF